MPARVPFAALLGAVVATFALTACADDIPRPRPTAEAIVGDYELSSVSYPDAPSGFLSDAFGTGTMTLTATRYEIDVVWHDTEEPEPPLRDEGTYRVEGEGVGSWTQESDVTGLTSTGTFTFDGSHLDVDVTIDGAPHAFRWDRL